MAKLWKKPKRSSSWRKLSVGMWTRPSDPTVYGHETHPADKILTYLEEVSEYSGQKVTMTAYLVKSMALMFALYPELNSIVVGNRVMQRENVDIFCQVAVAGGDGKDADLSGVKIRNADRLSIVEIAEYLHSRATRVRKGQDEEIEQTKSMIDKIPPLLLPTVMRLVDILTFVVPVDLGKLGIRDDPFGSGMVTNCAPFNIRLGLAPLVPASRTPLVLLPGAIYEAPAVVDGEVKVTQVMSSSFTLDHRCYDGYHIGKLVTTMRECLMDPAYHHPPAETFKKTHVDQAKKAEKKPEAAADDAPRQRTPESSAKAPA
ncbi:2-oxo acid dehydrogenase subunit E2 [Lujinxingia litoralis]|nr:2-oxo acid dehydrogenase subunit E2 [Lujinxingia litoralis]